MAASARTPPTPSTISCSIRVVAVAAIEAMRDIAVVFAVLLEIGIEEIQHYVAHARLPDLYRDAAPPQIHLHVQVLAIRAIDRGDRQVVEIGVDVLRVLVAFAVDGLMEVALPVQEADPDERQPHIARRLAVVPREDAKSARVDRQALVESEFGTEVRDEVVRAQPFRAVAAERLGMVRVIGGEDAVESVQEDWIVGGIEEALLVDALQERLRAMAYRIPQVLVQAARRARASRDPSYTRGCWRVLRA